MAQHRRESADEMAKHRQEVAAQLEKHRQESNAALALHRQESNAALEKHALALADKIRAAKYDLVKWFFPAFVALAGIVIAAAALLD